MMIFFQFFRHQYRYEAVLMRQRFEESRHEKDMRKCAAMVEAGEEEVWQNQAAQQFIYRNDEHGITYGRQAHIEDHMLNEWHPWEKVSFPENRKFNLSKKFVKLNEVECQQTLTSFPFS